MPAGRPQVVFVPGFMQSASAWMDVAERVGERYLSTCLDHRSDTAEARIAEIRAAVAPDDAVVAYSLGGRLALHAIVGGMRASALVLVGASAGIVDRDERLCRRREDEELAAWIERQPIDAVVERWEGNPVFSTQPRELVARQRAWRLSHDPLRLARLLRSAGQGALAPVWDQLPELELPILALAGESDRRYAAQAREIAALAPNAEALTVAGAGHAPQLEQPERVAERVIDFLGRCRFPQRA